jgi:hypothetical protein
MALLAMAVLSTITAAQPPPLAPLLTRLAEEADVFSRSIERIVAEETIRQRAIKRRKPRLRIGRAAMVDPEPEYQERELKSEFGYAASEGSIHEARQVREVNGKLVGTAANARNRLVAGIRSDDDRVKKALLEELERHGLEGAATDFTLCILLFDQRRQADYEFRDTGIERSGTDSARVILFRQKSGDGGMTVFQGKQMLRPAISGRLLLRESDGLPLKIRVDSKVPIPGSDLPMEDSGEVEYARNQAGLLLPVSVVHRRRQGAVLIAEERFTYANFQRFSTDSDIKFTPVDSEDPPR